MKLSAIIKPLLDAKADPEQIMALIRAYEDEVEQGKEKARARWRNWKERQSTNVGKRLQTRTNVSKQLAGGDARVEDKTLTSEIEPQKEEKNSAPASPSPRQLLETVLDAEHAEAVLDHRKRIKAPLGPRGAQLMAKELAKCPDPNAAADTIVLRGWRGFEAAWLTDPARQRAGPAPKLAPIDHFRNLASELNGQDRDDRGPGGHRDDAPGIPLRTIEHHG